MMQLRLLCTRHDSIDPIRIGDLGPPRRHAISGQRLFQGPMRIGPGPTLQPLLLVPKAVYRCPSFLAMSPGKAVVQCNTSCPLTATSKRSHLGMSARKKSGKLENSLPLTGAKIGRAHV